MIGVPCVIYSNRLRDAGCPLRHRFLCARDLRLIQAWFIRGSSVVHAWFTGSRAVHGWFMVKHRPTGQHAADRNPGTSRETPHSSAHVLRQTVLQTRHPNTASEYMMAAPDNATHAGWLHSIPTILIARMPAAWHHSRCAQCAPIYVCVCICQL